MYKIIILTKYYWLCDYYGVAHMNTHLAEYIRIGVILQKHSGCAGVVVACCNVQRREADFSFCAIINE